MIFTNILLFCLVLIEGCNLLIRLIKFSNDNEDIPPIDEEIRKRMYA